MMNNLGHSIWAMEKSSLDRLISSISLSGDMKSLSLSPSEKKKIRVMDVEGDTASIHISGTLLKSVPGFFSDFGISATGYADIKNAVNEAVENPNVKHIKLKIDSPGGCVDGVDLAADAIYAARNIKTVTAECGGVCASAAFWLASQAEKITAPKTSLIGSIGVYSVISDYSKLMKSNGIDTHVFRSGHLKGAGITGDVLTDEQAEVEQELVDQMATLFQKYVSQGRKKNSAMVKEWMTGRVWLAQAARDLGLIDEIETNEMQSSVNQTRMDSMKNKGKMKAEVVEDEEILDEEVVEDEEVAEVVEDEEVVEDDVETTDEETVEEDDDTASVAVDGEDEEETEEQIIEEDEDENAKAASVHVLEAEFSDNPKFIIESLKNKWSLLEAKAAYSDVLREKMKKNVKGTAPVAFGSSQKNPADFWSLVNEKVAAGKTKIQALSEVHKENPGIVVPPKK